MHYILQVKDAGLQYKVGDSVGIFPTNPPEIVEKTLHALGVGGDAPLRHFLATQANLKSCSHKLLNRLTATPPEDVRHFLDNHEVWDLLKFYGEVKIDPEEFRSLLMPLLPRFYSIASSQSVVGEEIPLTVANLAYETNGKRRVGICSHFLVEVSLNEAVVPLYIQPNHQGFTIPEETSTPLIMIGPGTGVAPFRGFLQERVQQKAVGENWLFFGEWTREGEFFYQEEFEKWVEEGFLRLTTAFSRDQDHKIYVQDRMWEHAQELYDWIQRGAIIYVCGDAEKMAKDVEATLMKIGEEIGRVDGRSFIKKLRTEKKYLRDIY